MCLSTLLLSPRFSLSPLWVCIKNPTNLIKQYFRVLSFRLLWLWGWSCRRIAKIRHIVWWQRKARNAWNQQKKIPAMGKILWQRKRLGENNLQWEKNYIFLLLLLTFYLVIVCSYIGRNVEPACTPWSIKMIWCKYKWDWIFFSLWTLTNCLALLTYTLCCHCQLRRHHHIRFICGKAVTVAKPLCTRRSRKSLT